MQEPTTREEIEAVLRAKIEADEAKTGLYDTGLYFVEADSVDGEIVFTWFDTPMQISDLLN